MNTMAFEQFEAMDNQALAAVEGGFSDCATGILGTGGLGAVGGPWGIVGGAMVGAAAFCF
ncbi:Blp family class II bacteriocin [Streptococcus caviae]|uniref:Blp family class II bacteriocin n=1 Tax=Streptococcus sp. 'caviae' TaxID=1915004 RepID=UPI00094B95D5|nr:Blp family class II bacteriocin [Streptococcus sp. 'caviae']OLN83179.1 bacteriocin [Streptococcus sp. 'caviae']